MRPPWWLLSKSSELLSNPYVIIPATTYDVAMINGLSNLMEQGKIHDGDTIGHIWLDGEYGANGLCGAQYFAQRHHLTLRDTKPKVTRPHLGYARDPGGAAPEHQYHHRRAGRRAELRPGSLRRHSQRWRAGWNPASEATLTRRRVLVRWWCW